MATSSPYYFTFDWTKPVLIEPIVRIKPELGIQVTYDSNMSRATDAYASAGMFRGFEIFMRNKPAPDVIMLSSRECGICGEHHQYIERVAQEMAQGGNPPPPLGLEGIMLANDAAMSYDATAHLTALGGPDWSSLFFKIAGYFPPQIYEIAQQTPLSKVAQYSKAFPMGAPTQLQMAGTTINTIADLMDSLVPIIGAYFLEGAYSWRIWHEAELLYYLRIPHPISMVPGGIGVPPTVENMQRYLQRMIDGTAWMMKQMAAYEYLDLFLADYDNVFGIQGIYDKLNGTLGFAEEGNRPGNFVSYGQSDVSEAPTVTPSSTTVSPYDATYENMGAWGRARVVKPGLVIQTSPTSAPQLVTNDLIDINLGVREFVESSWYTPWYSNGAFSSEVPSNVSGITEDPIGNPVSYYHPWRKWTIPKPEPRPIPMAYPTPYSWAMSPRFVPYQNHKPISNLYYNVEADPMAVMYAQVLQPQAPTPIYTCEYPVGYGIKYNSNEMSATWYLPTVRSSTVKLPPEFQQGSEIEFKYIAPYKLSGGKIVTNAIERMRARAFMAGIDTMGAWIAWLTAMSYIKQGKTEVSSMPPSSWTYKKNTNQDVAIGVGMKEAPRGAQFHSEVISTGMGVNVPAINPQQMQPTTVNAGPRVKSTYDDGIQTIKPASPTHGAGTFEEAIMGNPDYNILGTPRLTIIPTDQWDGFEYAQTLRSFDPCFVCGVHIAIPNGRVIYTTLGAPVDLSNAIKTFYRFAMKVK
ncbi:nickel-dependent hydrogenase large subunit [Acidianus sp. RZ1]|uniref:nickel-dependent hydrogenase large subunit n=1 Tax=Acidianus sp. RZ1 TaxID=1540082 RepID=UPI0014925CC0|nr:nickel-dependent hydrogenase large subunit [Acidianus sp. RZ1]NON62498.1 Ni Fe-hydrogenase I large subunit [Acidianus sp. RZ1]